MVSGGSLQNYLRSHDELIQRAYDIIAGIRAACLKLNIGRVLPLAQAVQVNELFQSPFKLARTRFIPDKSNNQHCG
jgi:hypothetical protein